MASDLPDDLEHDHISNYEISDDAAEAARQARRQAKMSDLYQAVSSALAAEPLLEGLQLRDRAWATVHGWDGDEEDGYILRSYTEALETEVERLRDALRGLLDGLDDYWVMLPEGIAAVEAARAALAGEGDEETRPTKGDQDWIDRANAARWLAAREKEDS